jgi:hypothetical protein
MSGALKRLSSKSCSGSQVRTNSMSCWYVPVDAAGALKDIQIRETCYLDH